MVLSVVLMVDSTIEDPADDVRRSPAPVGKYEGAASDDCVWIAMLMVMVVVRLAEVKIRWECSR